MKQACSSHLYVPLVMRKGISTPTAQVHTPLERAIRNGEHAQARQMIDEALLENAPGSERHHNAVIAKARVLRMTEGYASSTRWASSQRAANAATLTDTQRDDLDATIAEDVRISGRHPEAWIEHERLLKRASDTQNYRLHLWAALGLARTACLDRHFTLALDLFSHCAVLAEGRGDWKNLAWSVRGQADTLFDSKGPSDTVEDLLEVSAGLFEYDGHSVGGAWVMLSQADLHAARGDDRSAMDRVEASLNTFGSLDGRGAAFARAKRGLLLLSQDAGSLRGRSEIRWAATFFEKMSIAPGSAMVFEGMRLLDPKWQKP